MPSTDLLDWDDFGRRHITLRHSAAHLVTNDALKFIHQPVIGNLVIGLAVNENQAQLPPASPTLAARASPGPLTQQPITATSMDS